MRFSLTGISINDRDLALSYISSCDDEYEGKELIGAGGNFSECHCCVSNLQSFVWLASSVGRESLFALQIHHMFVECRDLGRGE